jgi:hypothetical protein
MSELTVINGLLVESADQCTCEGESPVEGVGHRPDCGWYPLAPVEEVLAALAAAGVLPVAEASTPSQLPVAPNLGVAEAGDSAAERADTDPLLIAELRKLGDNYGPLGVALAAASLPDTRVLVQRLTEWPECRVPAPAASVRNTVDEAPDCTTCGKPFAWHMLQASRIIPVGHEYTMSGEEAEATGDSDPAVQPDTAAQDAFAELPAFIQAQFSENAKRALRNTDLRCPCVVAEQRYPECPYHGKDVDAPTKPASDLQRGSDAPSKVAPAAQPGERVTATMRYGAPRTGVLDPDYGLALHDEVVLRDDAGHHWYVMRDSVRPADVTETPAPIDAYFLRAISAKALRHTDDGEWEVRVTPGHLGTWALANDDTVARLRILLQDGHVERDRDGYVHFVTEVLPAGQPGEVAAAEQGCDGGYACSAAVHVEGCFALPAAGEPGGES